MKDYDPKNIEAKWQDRWHKDETYKAPNEVSGKENEYILVEFAYPSGNLHAGHWYAFSVPDIYARYRRMIGKNVLYPMGFDAFGLPAENAAIKNNLNPRDWTFSNIEYMRKQLRSMGASFDWSREVITASPEYYKWTQWLFLKFFEKGLAYRKDTPVNWCPKDKTVLANEQVIDGKCDRCGTVVEKRDMLQWNLKITDYADRLIDDLEALDWPKPIKDAQKNWIGRSKGAEIDFLLDFKKDPKANDNRGPNGERAALKVFTTRPDTIFGATYLVLAPEHLWVTLATDDKHNVLENKEEVKKYIQSVKNRTDIERSALNKEKVGVELRGVKAINPATKEEIPIWVADYVLPNYGTGAIMAVPAHDERDRAFAKKYNLPVTKVIEPMFVNTTEEGKWKEGLPIIERDAIMAVVKHWSEDKYLGLRYKSVDWRTFVTGGPEEGESMLEGAISEIKQETGYLHPRFIKNLGKVHSKFYHVPKKANRLAHFTTFYFELEDGERQDISDEEKKLHEAEWLTKEQMAEFLTAKAHKYAWDDLFGEALYDGEGILINSGKFDGRDSQDAKDEITKFVGGEEKTTFRLRDWVVSRQRYWGCPIPVIHCEKCGVVAVPDKDLPVILPDVDDYLPRDDGQSPLSKAEAWVNVKCPKCGSDAKRETDTFDTFIDSSWYFLRYADPKNSEEFASKESLSSWMPVDFYSGGAEHTTMHLLYSRFFHKALFDLGLVNEPEPYKRRMNRGLILGPDGHKMSKSKGNVIDPDDYVRRLGADTVRTYLAFIGPYNEVGSYPWNPDSIVGVRRFLERVWNMKSKLDAGIVDEVIMNRTIKEVGESVAKIKMNTAVPVLMSLINTVDKTGITKNQFEVLLKLLAPFAPHMTEELWSELGYKTSIHTEEWPKYNESKLERSEVTYAVQVNGKVRGNITVDKSVIGQELEAMAKSLPEVGKWLDGKTVDKVIVVPGKVVNVVVS